MEKYKATLALILYLRGGHIYAGTSTHFDFIKFLRLNRFKRLLEFILELYQLSADSILFQTTPHYFRHLAATWNKNCLIMNEFQQAPFDT